MVSVLCDGERVSWAGAPLVTTGCSGAGAYYGTSLPAAAADPMMARSLRLSRSRPWRGAPRLGAGCLLHQFLDLGVEGWCRRMRMIAAAGKFSPVVRVVLALAPRFGPAFAKVERQRTVVVRSIDPGAGCNRSARQPPDEDAGSDCGIPE